jgi:hypothetical protein
VSGPSGQPLYKGEPLDSERGPGLGCFWIQVITLAVLLILTPLTVVWAWDPVISAILLFVTLALVFFAGQTVIFLLRLVAADRRSRRHPLDPSARPTVGQLEEEAGTGGNDGTGGTGGTGGTESDAPPVALDPTPADPEDGR